MKQYWEILSAKLSALNQRERILVFLAVIVSSFLLLQSLLLNPTLDQIHQSQNEISTDEATIANLKQKLIEYNSQKIIDPDAQSKDKISHLQFLLQEKNQQLNGIQTTLVNPDKMPDVLRGLLQKNGKLKLIQLKTLPVSGLLDSKTVVIDEHIKSNNNGDLPIFKHGVEITIEGRYLDLLDYVNTLEQLPWHLLWSKANLDANNSLQNQLKLTVYTLSLDKAWLSI